MNGKIIFILGIFFCLLFFGNMIGIAEADDENIARRYAPILFFEKDETCFPVNVSYHIDNSYLYQIGIESPIDLLPTAESISSYGEGYYYLDNQRGTIDDNGIINDYKTKNLRYTVYSHILNSGQTTIIQYWMFYAFNKGIMNQHEGDWEMVQVVLSSGKPNQVMYSQHHNGQKASWDQVEKDKNHIKVYVSRGSHANYLRSYSGVVGIANDIVGSNGLVLSSIDYDLVMLESEPWLDFGGFWGWCGTTEEEFELASLLGQNGPNGPKFRQEGSMWNAIEWGNNLFEADNNIFFLELILYNFVNIFIILTIVIICILLFHIYRRYKRKGLGPRIISILYIDRFNLKSIGNILCIIGIIIAIIALVSPWYLISSDIRVSGIETHGMENMLTLDGINGMQIKVPGLTGPIPVGSIIVPFSLLIGISLVFLIFASIGISDSRKLGGKYIFKGIRLIIPFVIIILIIIALGMIPFESLADTGDSNVDVGEIVNEISGSPMGGNYIVSIPEVDGQIEFEWGFGLGGFMLLFSGVILIIAGILEYTTNTVFFYENSMDKIKNDKKMKEEIKNNEKDIKSVNNKQDEIKNKEISDKMAGGFCPNCGNKFKSKLITNEACEIYTICNHCGKKLTQKKR
jgi:hypothetical protein